MNYDTNYLWGMHLVWWFVWMGLLFWIFALPYNISGQRNNKSTPLDVLKKRFSFGDITKEEYYKMKRIIEG